MPQQPYLGERRTKDGITGEWDGRGWRRVDDEPTPSLSVRISGEPSPSPPPPTQAQPRLGERRTKDGVTGIWDGKGWLRVNEEPASVEGFLSNVGDSFGKMVTDTVSGGIDIAKFVGRGLEAQRDPRKAKELSDDLFKTIQAAPQIASALGHAFMDRYGSMEAIRHTLYTDPVGVASDLATVLTGGGALVKGAGMATKMPQAVRLGIQAGRLGDTIDPLTATVRGISKGVDAATTFGLSKSLNVTPEMERGLNVSPRQMAEATKAARIRSGRSAGQKAASVEAARDSILSRTQAAVPADELVRGVRQAMGTAGQDASIGMPTTAVEEALEALRTKHVDPQLDRTIAGLEARFPKAGDEVGGRGVRGRPNEDIIDARLPQGQRLGGIRDVRMSEMDPTHVPIGDIDTRQLAQEIDVDERVKPLIIALDQNRHPYVLQGGRRFDALKLLGAQAFPARVVMDPTRMPRTQLKTIPAKEARGLELHARKRAGELPKGSIEAEIAGNEASQLRKSLHRRVVGLEQADRSSEVLRGIEEAWRTSKQGGNLLPFGTSGVGLMTGGLPGLGAGAVAGVGLKVAQMPAVQATAGIAAQDLHRLMSNPQLIRALQVMRLEGASDDAIKAALYRALQGE